ncbi:CpsD/CapB family tyrosine-protein kinase [Sulfitobacter sabulilitoris]|nr:CpsD/CapB family tyrosine-protein kinase [Sulfitobacter sabulilitoris]
MTKGPKPIKRSHERAMQHRLMKSAARTDLTNPDAPRWQDLRGVSPGVRSHILGHAPLVDFHRETAASKAFDLLRTRLIQTIKLNGWSRIAISAPTSGCGSTFTAVNLALSLSRVPGSRTVLMDLNLRNPGVADALDLHGEGDMRAFLQGEAPLARHIVRANDTLALGLNSTPDANAAECLHDPRTARTLDRMRNTFQTDIVLYDMPAMLAHDDVAAFLPQVDGVLLISDGTQTQAKHLAECERILDGQTQLLGVILNRARASGIESYS